MSYESRSKLIKAINANKINYQKSFLNNNLYAEISVLGELKENDEKEEGAFHPKYKFFVNEIKDIRILSEEIYPNDGARGLESINKKWNK